MLPQASFAQSTILVFGDSLSAGYGIPHDAAWPNLLSEHLSKTHPHYKVVNASISGETTSGGLSRFPAALKAHHPDIVILELGANDGLRGTPLDITSKNLSSMIKLAKDAKSSVLLLGMQLPPNYGAAYTGRFKSMYSNISSKYQIAMVPFMLQGISAEQFQADNLHPVAEAQSIILKNVMKYLLTLLK